jgi:lipopolysaccharide biosynthesis regulator YciM
LHAALKLDPDCIEAALYLARVLLRQGRLQRAFHVWDGLAKARPEFLFLAFRDMQAAFRQLENEAGWEGFLRAYTARHPGDPTGYLALAEWYTSRSQTEEAMRYLRQVLELDPVCREAHMALLSFYRTQGIPGEVLDSYERLVAGMPQPCSGRFRCGVCGHTREEPFWKCPTCHAWITPERLLPQPSAMPIMVGEVAQQLGHASAGASAPIAMTREAPVYSRPGA